MNEVLKLEAKIDKLTDKIQELSIQVATKIESQDNLKERIIKLERNQYFIVTAVIGGLIKFVFEFIQSK